MNPGLTLSKAENLSYGRLIMIIRASLATFEANSGPYEGAPAATFNIHYEQDRTLT
jgi:hypothetical protein